jgi:Protein kinase domain
MTFVIGGKGRCMIAQGNHVTELNGSRQALDVIAGKYEVLEELGRSAAGTTYKVRHTLLDSVLRVTVLAVEVTGDEDRLGQLQRRLRDAMPLRHEHLLQVLDFGKEAGRHHVVEEMIQGETLESILSSGVSLPAPTALRIARQVADALTYAHERGVVHGTVTAGNIVVQRGATERAVLGGLALGALAISPSAVLACSAPERLSAGASAADARSDVFALGLLLFEMIEGKGYFAGLSDADIQERLQATAQPLLPQFSTIAPSGVPALIARAMRRLPEERQQSMAQLRTELDVCLHRFATPSVPSDAPANTKARALLAAAKPKARTPLALAKPEPAAATPEGAPGERKIVRVAFPDDDDLADVAPMAAPSVSRRVLARGGMSVSIPMGVPVIAGVLGAAVLAVLGALLFHPVDSTMHAPGTKKAPAAAPVKVAAPAPAAAEPGPVAAATAPVASVEAERPARRSPATEDNPEKNERASATPPPSRASRNMPPSVQSSHPARGELVSVMEGKSVKFSATAVDADSDDAVAYEWLFDGRKVSGHQSWRFVATRAVASRVHRVELRVSDSTGLRAPRLSWDVQVVTPMTEDNVRDWLARLGTAFERNDITTLRLYGMVRTDAQAEAMRARLAAYKGARVAIGNELIKLNGRFASAGVDMAWLGKGGKILAAGRQTYEIEKQPGGLVTLRTR